jgi:putative tryptophan/tyrosine transport system substrate-binding protein
MQRREFIAGLGSAAAWPVVARAQQPERMRRIGLLMSRDEDDPEIQTRLSGLMQGLAKLGWDGRSLLMDVRWAAANNDRMRTYAKELVNLQPDVIFGSSTPAIAALQRETRTIPIVFAGLPDPVGVGFVASLPRPGGNITGFINMEGSLGGKWLELLMEIAPGVKRVAIVFSPDSATASYYLPSFEAAARSLKVMSIAAPVRSETEIETTITSLASEPRGALVFPPDIFTNVHRALIILLAARNNLPSVSVNLVLARDGGLLSYGADSVDMWRRSAAYVDRILRGVRPSDLPVQLPTKFAMAINLKTAKALGLTVPQSIMLLAYEVIQ